MEVADSQVPNVVMCGVSEGFLTLIYCSVGLWTRTYFQSCSGDFLADLEHVDACLYYMVYTLMFANILKIRNSNLLGTRRELSVHSTIS